LSLDAFGFSSRQNFQRDSALQVGFAMLDSRGPGNRDSAAPGAVLFIRLRAPLFTGASPPCQEAGRPSSLSFP
jgi:hypothetical protein